MKLKAALHVLALSASLALVAGCQTSRVGVKNHLGTYTTMVDASPEDVTDAARETLEDMGLELESDQATSIDGKLVAKTATSRKVTVTTETAGENVTELSIRVGGGDEALSFRILDQIKEKL